jgi:hypothetical protein
MINIMDKKWNGNPMKVRIMVTSLRCVVYDVFASNEQSPDMLQYSWTSDFVPDYAQIKDGMLEVSMKYDGSKTNEAGNYAGFGSRVSWTRFMLYGKVTARIKTGSCALGVVSSFIVSSLIACTYKHAIGNRFLRSLSYIC